MRLKKSKITALLILILSALLSTTVLAYEYPNAAATVYATMPGYYCVEHEASLTWRVEGGNGGTVNGLLFNSGYSEDMDITVAYAKYMGLTGAQMQNVIWASQNNSGVKEALAIERVKQYKEVYDNIYKIAGDQNILKETTDIENLKVMVDQEGGTYTVGPYKIDLNVGDRNSKAAKILLNELRKENADYSEESKFATFYGIENINGTDVKMIDEKGQELKFPDFDQEFYLRFIPNNNGAITETGNPVFKVDFLTSIEGDVNKYVSTEVEVTLNYEAAEFIGKASFPTPPSRDEEYNGSYTQSVTVTVTRDIVNHHGTVADTETKTVTVYRNVSYTKGVPHVGAPYVNEPIQPETKVVQVPHAKSIYIDVQEEGSLTEVEEKVTEIYPEGKIKYQDWYGPSSTGLQLPGRPIDMQLGGKVWLDTPDVKTGNLTGTNSDGDSPFAGIQVTLYEVNGNEASPVATTITDSEGKYRFYGKKEDGTSLINPLRKYCVIFTYNGQMYQATYYRNDLTGGFSNAKDNQREEFNAKFESIYSEPENYKTDKWNKAYALEQKIEKDDGSYIDLNGRALTYQDVYTMFLAIATIKENAGEPSENDYDTVWNRSRNYTEVLSGEFTEWLKGMGINNELPSIVQFINDTFIQAYTYNGSDLKQLYPVYDQFVIRNIDENSDEYKLENTKTVTLDMTYTYLYSINSDQARHVDFGVANREVHDLALQKDVYKATVLVNGKKEEYIYNKKDVDNDGTWNVNVRASDSLYNGQEIYNREVRKSEYLYDGSDAGSTDAKNLQVYVTYRLAVKNQGVVDTKINEIVDYYDESTYAFDGDVNGDTYTPKSYNNYDENGNVTSTYVNSYVGSDKKGGKLKDITVKTNGIPISEPRAGETIEGANYKYSTVYLTGITSPSGNEILHPGELAFAYVTFKVKNDPATEKVKLDQDLTNGTVTIGKRNIAEINGYSTYYVDGATIPDTLGDYNSATGEYSRNDKDVSGKTPGLIDTDSNPGSLKARDLNDNGDIITDPNNPVNDRQQDDTDKAPNIRVIIDINDDDIRRLKGYVYEDERTEASDKAAVGNGIDNEETKINGVTLQLVELVQNVDDNGMFKGSYQGEKVWASYSYNGIDANSLNNASKNYDRYFSGIGTSKIIINGPEGTILHIGNDTLGEGEYTFKSVPSGDFYIRFVYGDTTQTVLTNTENEVNSLIGTTGLNAKSYNGQDYKSTVYQAGVNQETSYNGINGYIDYENQNYYKVDDLKVDATNDVIYSEPNPNKANMYYYDIENSTVAGVSDAKDVYEYREMVNNWSKGANGTSLVNNRAEVLASFEKLATYKPYVGDTDNIDTAAQKANQESMIQELMNNTFMVAQTGIINTQVEYNRGVTNYGDSLNYTVDDIDLGLVERPESALKLNKEITNFRLTLANNQVLFDTDKSVNNLYFSKHQEHDVQYNTINRIREVTLNANKKPESAELLQAYVDDELMVGATINARYKITVQNVGEVDYKDKQFYYIGQTSDNSEANISKTDAVQVIDYVSNEIRYEQAAQEAQWNTKTSTDIITDNKENDLVNRQYKPEVDTYNVLLTTNGLSGMLTPTVAETGTTGKETSLILSTKVAGTHSAENLVYNNLSEIVEVSNELGRRCQYSIVGNQQMADQSLGNNASSEYASKVDRITPAEIDADSAQKIVIMPPTGQADYTMLIIGSSLAAALILAAILFMKKGLKKGEQ